MLGDQLAELADENFMAAERQVGVNPILDDLETQLLETLDLGPRERLVRHVGERRAAPQRERRPKTLRRRPRITGVKQSPALRRQPQETLGVKLMWVDVKHVPRRPRHQQLVL